MRVSTVFLGGALKPWEARGGEIRHDVAQGPVPPHLLRLVHHEETVAPSPPPPKAKKARVSKLKPKPKRSAPKTPRPRREPKPKAERPNLWPCPSCGSPSRGKGSAWGGGAWRKCTAEGCLLRFRTVPLHSTKGVWPPCPHCEGRTVANGTRSGKQILKCLGCGKTHRREAQP